jgi:hypothetical protein
MVIIIMHPQCLMIAFHIMVASNCSILVSSCQIQVLPCVKSECIIKYNNKPSIRNIFWPSFGQNIFLHGNHHHVSECLLMHFDDHIPNSDFPQLRKFGIAFS